MGIITGFLLVCYTRAANHGIKCIWWDDGFAYRIIDRNEPTASDVKLIRALHDGTNSWGTLTLNFDGSGYPVEANKILTISIKVRNEASSVKLQRLLFYTAEGTLLEGAIELIGSYYQGIVPKNAVYMRVSVNSLSKNISWEEFEKYLKAGDIELELHMFEPDEVEQIQFIK